MKNDYPELIKPMEHHSGIKNKLPIGLIQACEQLDLALDHWEQPSFIKNMIALEHIYWKYLDEYNEVDRLQYPYMSFHTFIEQVSTCSNIKDALRHYNRYKKSLNTAGIIFYYKDNDHPNEIYFVVVKINRAPIYSMPKGKQDFKETIVETASREFKEETGIDLSEYISNTTPRCSILKTIFFIVESDSIFHINYQSNEIKNVKWVSCTEVLNNPEVYSKQVFLTAKSLYIDKKIRQYI